MINLFGKRLEWQLRLRGYRAGFAFHAPGDGRGLLAAAYFVHRPPAETPTACRLPHPQIKRKELNHGY